MVVELGAQFQFHEDNCNQQPESESFSDSSSGTDFHSAQVNSVSYDDVAHTVTIAGLGTNNGLPVAFTLVGADSTLVQPGLFSITLSTTNRGTRRTTSHSIQSKCQSTLMCLYRIAVHVEIAIISTPPGLLTT